MPDLHIFDPYDSRLAILSNDAKSACPFWSAPFKEVLNKGSTFEFICPADHSDSQYIVAENQVAFPDKDGDFRLFVIRETDDSDGNNGPEIHAICEPAMYELNDEIITNQQPTNTTAQVALTDALSGTRWQVGTVASLGNNSTSFYYISSTAAIQDIINTWGGELKDRVEFNDTSITGRYIDILARRGADTGKRWEIDKDIESITRTIKSYPKTALYGRGTSQQTNSDGTTQKLTFANVVWSKSNGDPADKPAGQEWVGDPDALQQFGRKNDDGSLRHRFGVFQDSSQKDSAALLQDTWDALQQQKKQTKNFAMSVFLLEAITGYEHEKVRLGDTTFAIDRSFAKPIEVEERVISFEYDISDPNNSGTVELGDYIDLFEDQKKLDKVTSQLNDGSGIWNKAGDPVTDGDFPDTKPPVPTNFTATGLFKIIQLVWDYDSASYIAAYEIYASQVQGFTPDSSNLVFRGKTGSYNFGADTDQQWYFQIRAINTHGTASDFTSEVSAQTVQIANKDIAPLTITNELIAENAEIDGAKIANETVTNAQIANVSADKINAGKLTTQYLQVGDFTNYCTNPQFQDGTNADWAAGTVVDTSTIADSANAPGKYANHQNGRDNVNGKYFPVNDGDQFYVEAWVLSANSAGSYTFGIGLQLQKDDGTFDWIRAFSATASQTTWKKFSGTVTVPSGFTIAKVWAQDNVASGSTDPDGFYYTKVVVRRMNETALIEDAAITSAKIKSLDAGKITTGILSGIDIESPGSSGNSTIQITDGYLLNTKDINNPTANPRTYIEDGYILIRNAGTRQYTTQKYNSFNYDDLDVGSAYEFFSSTGFLFNLGSGVVEVAGGINTHSVNVDPKSNVNAGIELGSTTAATTPFIDFHSFGSPANDFDARILASSGSSGANGKGTLQLIANHLDASIASSTFENLTAAWLQATDHINTPYIDFTQTGTVPGSSNGRLWYGNGYAGNNLYINVSGTWYHLTKSSA